MIAAIVSTLIGNMWGVSTLLSGLVQGLGAELIFLLFFYRRFTLPVAMLAGAGAALGAWVIELFYGSSPDILDARVQRVYLCQLVVSGALIAGVVGLARGAGARGHRRARPVRVRTRSAPRV